MKFSVDPWDPSYGTAAEFPDDSTVSVELDVEVDEDDWAPITPRSTPTGRLTVVDGVRRIEARVWVERSGGATPGVCASWAAGSVRCGDGRAELADVEVGRTFAAPGPIEELDAIATPHGVYEPMAAEDGRPEQLWLAVQKAMGRAERRITELAAANSGGLVIVDGPLKGRDHLAGVVGMVKTHHVRYIEGAAGAVLSRLEEGQRTPAFTISGGYTRRSWYVRLPTAGGAGVPMAGVVRCEAPVGVRGGALSELADRTVVEMVRLASEPHKDRRAPQNLYPIAGLEKLLRHRLGDPQLLYRSLRSAAGGLARI